MCKLSLKLGASHPDSSRSSALSFHSSCSDNSVSHPHLFVLHEVTSYTLLLFHVAGSHTPCSTHEWQLCLRSEVTALWLCVCLHLISLTVISVTLFTFRSGGVTWGLLPAEFTACWLDAAVRGGVWRETVECKASARTVWQHIDCWLLFVQTTRNLKACRYIHVSTVQNTSALHWWIIHVHPAPCAGNQWWTPSVFSISPLQHPLKYNLHYASFPFVLIQYGL